MKIFKGVRTVVIEESVEVDAEDALEAWLKMTNGGDDITIVSEISQKITAGRIQEKNYYVDFATGKIKEKIND